MVGTDPRFEGAGPGVRVGLGLDTVGPQRRLQRSNGETREGDPARGTCRIWYHEMQHIWILGPSERAVSFLTRRVSCLKRRGAMKDDHARHHDPEGLPGVPLRLMREGGPSMERDGDGWGDRTAGERSRVYYDRLLLPEDRHLRFIEVSEIIWVEADGNYVRIHTRRGEHLIRRSLRDVSDLLDPRRFVRIHRSTVVNLEEVDHLEPWFSGGYLVRLRTGEELKISRHYAAKLTHRAWWVG